MTPEVLAASLAAAGSADSMPDALYFDDTRYADWSIRLDDGTRVLELGSLDGDVAQLELTLAEMRQLHAQLTATLIAETAREAAQ